MNVRRGCLYGLPQYGKRRFLVDTLQAPGPAARALGLEAASGLGAVAGSARALALPGFIPSPPAVGDVPSICRFYNVGDLAWVFELKFST